MHVEILILQGYILSRKKPIQINSLKRCIYFEIQKNQYRYNRNDINHSLNCDIKVHSFISVIPTKSKETWLHVMFDFIGFSMRFWNFRN